MSDDNDTMAIDAQLQQITSGGKAEYASADVATQLICTSYLRVPDDRDPAEYTSFDLFVDEPTTTLQRVGFSGSDDDGNYAIYESEGGAVTGLYLHRSIFDGEAPDEIGMSLSGSSEEAFNEAENEADDEAADLLA